jgi:uncharacterized protein
MKIDISSIVKANGASLDINYDDKLPGLNEAVNDYEFVKPVEFKGSLLNASGIIKLDGLLKAEYVSKCSRCLKDIICQMNIKVKEDFLEKDESTGSEVYTYQDNYILIDHVLKDNIILNLPVKQVCNENCKGLCPKCGIDFNTNECLCKEDEINPQMEVLKDFFNN